MTYRQNIGILSTNVQTLVKVCKKCAGTPRFTTKRQVKLNLVIKVASIELKLSHINKRGNRPYT